MRLLYATLLLQAADWENGLQNLEQVRVSAPWSPVVEAYIGGALVGLNRVSDAKDTLDAAIALAPNDFYLLLKRGEVYCRLGIYQTAIDALERASHIAVDEPVGREAVRRLLRFARDKNIGGFVRQPRAHTTGFTFKWPWRAAPPACAAARPRRVSPLRGRGAAARPHRSRRGRRAHRATARTRAQDKLLRDRPLD